MRCLTYARVSTDKQAEKELSIPAQLQAMRQYASERNWHIVQEFVEAGASARTAARPVLHQLLARCRDPRDPIDVVVVHKIDRLARNVADHAMIRTLLRQHRIRLASVVENLEDSVSGQLVEHMMAAIAEFYSSNLSEETKKGMRQKVLQGGWPHQPPRGYQIVRDGNRSRVEVHPVDGPLVAELFQLYVSGWYSIPRLTAHLVSRGIRSRRGGVFGHSYVHRILTNPFYAGRLVWNDLRVPGNHPALVSPAVFDHVQQQLSRRLRLKHRDSLVGFPLRSVAVCGRCGGRMGVDRHPRWSYYRCGRQSYRREHCAARFMRVERAHASLEATCRSLPLGAGATLWDVYGRLSDWDRVALIEQVFDAIGLDGDGIIDFRLKPTWPRAVAECRARALPGNDGYRLLPAAA